MLDVGFSEILLTSAIALIVLGPERLPKVARQVGNWMGRARAMARQLSEQLEREVSADELLKQSTRSSSKSGSAPTSSSIPPTVGNGAAFDPAYNSPPAYGEPPAVGPAPAVNPAPYGPAPVYDPTPSYESTPSHSASSDHSPSTAQAAASNAPPTFAPEAMPAHLTSAEAMHRNDPPTNHDPNLNANERSANDRPIER